MHDRYRSPINQGVRPAAEGEFQSIRLNDLEVWPPVVLAPMAGVTNWPFRMICRRFGAGLCVSEMITARPLAEGRERTLKLTDFGEEETPRSLQLYGVDPHFVGLAVERLVDEGRVDHIDLNFGCPVRKVTSKGGGAAIPAKPRLLQSIVRAAVRGAGTVPVTIKFRKGLDEERLSFLETGRIAEGEGCAAVTLHARTVADLYDGHADWEAIGQLKAAIGIPVIGNGDVWEGWDALRMMRATGCDGVSIGRGCLGRPWLFRDLADVFEGREPGDPPTFGEIVEVMLEHAAGLAEWMGELHAMRAFRRQASWYTKGFRASASMRRRLSQVENLRALESLLAEGDMVEAFPPSAMRVARGKTSGRQKVSLPEGFFNDSWRPPTAAGQAHSGG